MKSCFKKPAEMYRPGSVAQQNWEGAQGTLETLRLEKRGGTPPPAGAGPEEAGLSDTQRVQVAAENHSSDQEPGRSQF